MTIALGAGFVIAGCVAAVAYTVGRRHGWADCRKLSMKYEDELIATLLDGGRWERETAWQD